MECKDPEQSFVYVTQLVYILVQSRYFVCRISPQLRTVQLNGHPHHHLWKIYTQKQVNPELITRFVHREYAIISGIHLSSPKMGWSMLASCLNRTHLWWQSSKKAFKLLYLHLFYLISKTYFHFLRLLTLTLSTWPYGQLKAWSLSATEHLLQHLDNRKCWSRCLIHALLMSTSC